MLDVIASARPVYDPALQKLTLAIPSSVARGDTLLLVVVHANASSVTVPAGWTDLGSSNAGGITARRIACMVDGSESATLVVSTTAAGDEVQGLLVVLRGAGSLPLLVEASAALAFAATMAPGSPAISSLQATDLVIEVFSSSGSPTLTAPAGATAIDTYSTALLSARTLLVTKRRANATGALTLGAAAASVNATGATFALLLRDGLPVQPAELYDPMPGNIGLLGKDNRPPREAA